IQAAATTSMTHHGPRRAIPATTATAMMNPASIKNREPTTVTGGSYGCWSFRDSSAGVLPDDGASFAPEGSGAGSSVGGSLAFGVADGGDTGGAAAMAAAGDGGAAGVRPASVDSIAAFTISSATCLIWSSPRPAAASSCSVP